MNKESDNEFATNLRNNLMETWIRPSIENRQSDGLLPKPLPLQAAQIVFKLDGSKPLVRVNEEVRGEAKIRAKEGIEIREGDPVSTNQIEEIRSFKLPDDERDWGHATILNVEGIWAIFFDFIYNKRRSEEHLEAAREFLLVAAQSLEAGLGRPFIENLASASELAAKAFLLSRPDRSIMSAKSHSHIHTKLNIERRSGNVDEAHVEAFNLIQQYRYPARYLDRKFDLSSVDQEDLLRNIQAFVDEIESRVQVAF